MKTIIAGSRTISSFSVLQRAIEAAGWTPTEIISGNAYGVDRLGEQWATLHHLPLYLVPADWNRFGKRAGYLRNVQMAERAEALIGVGR